MRDDVFTTTTGGLYKTSDDKFVEKIKTLIGNSYSKNKKPSRKDFNDLKASIEVFNYPDQQTYIPDFEIGNDSFGIELAPWAFESVDIKTLMKQKIADSENKIVLLDTVIDTNSLLLAGNST